MLSDVQQLRMKSSGFTLLELVVVLSILGFIAGAVGLRLRAAIGAQAQEAAFERFQALDRLLRSRATSDGEDYLEIDFRQSVIRAIHDDEQIATSLDVPIFTVQTFRREYQRGVVRIPYFPDQSSASYCLKFQGPNWQDQFLVIGGTGQILLLDKESDAGGWDELL